MVPPRRSTPCCFILPHILLWEATAAQSRRRQARNPTAVAGRPGHRPAKTKREGGHERRPRLLSELFLLGGTCAWSVSETCSATMVLLERKKLSRKREAVCVSVWWADNREIFSRAANHLTWVSSPHGFQKQKSEYHRRNERRSNRGVRTRVDSRGTNGLPLPPRSPFSRSSVSVFREKGLYKKNKLGGAKVYCFKIQGSRANAPHCT